jgi:hypothetical protein
MRVELFQLRPSLRVESPSGREAARFEEGKGSRAPQPKPHSSGRFEVCVLQCRVRGAAALTALEARLGKEGTPSEVSD